MEFPDDAVSPFDEPIEDDDGGMPPDGADNRTFLLVAGALGGLILLTLVCMAVFMLRGRSGGSTRQAEVATINAQNTQVAEAMAKTQLAQAWTPTFTATAPPVTPTATPTAVVAMPTDTPTPAPPTATSTPDARQATVSALQTIQALTQTPQSGGAGASGTPTTTELPNTGFADEVGLPGLAIGAVALLLVIFVARRLRNA